MNKTIFITALSTSLIGGIIGVQAAFLYLPHYENKPLQEKPPINTTSIPVVQLDDSNTDPKSSYTDLTFASEQAVETVVHIQTKFVKEEITYDPFLRLFYGEDAYRIRKRHGQASGSGVIVAPDGYIVTNNHVVQDATEIKVLINGKEYIGELKGNDPSTDLAVIKIEASSLPYSTFGNSDNLKLGEWVIAVGNPLNLQSTVTAGIVSAKNRNIDLLTSQYDPEKNVFPIESFIQTDAAVNSGNSGGALVNVNGELVGINTAIASGTGYYTGYSFAIPSNIVKKVVYDIIKYGEVKRVRLGIIVTDNNHQVAENNGLFTEKGVLVSEVLQDGNADKSELKSNDVILSIEGIKISSVNELQAKIAAYDPGDSVEMKIMRGNEVKQIEVTLN